MQQYANSMQIVCKKCGYAWQYAGTKRRTSCSKCKTSITIRPQPKTVDGSKKLLITTSHNQQTVERLEPNLGEPSLFPNRKYRLPLQILDSLAFSRAKAWAKTNGEDIKLNSNSEGVLSLA